MFLQETKRWMAALALEGPAPSTFVGTADAPMRRCETPAHPLRERERERQSGGTNTAHHLKGSELGS
jgi:hypothetical protein